MKIPLAKIDIDDETVNAAISAVKSGQWLHGKRTEEFEERFAKFCNARYAACVSSGTAALFLALQSLGVKKGDEVIVPSLSFVATASTVVMCGAVPKFVDVDRRNYTINPLELEKRITKKSKGIIPVHLFGHAANMDKIKKIAKDHFLFVLEDAAQAHGAKYKGKMVGSFGEASCFSFYPSKNLTVCGDGGMVVSNNKELIERVKVLRNHGRKKKYVHIMLGYNFKLSEIQAGIGITRLRKLNKNNILRRRIATIYDSELNDKIIKPIEERWTKHVYHMYTIRVKFRDKLRNFLFKKNIGTGVYYPLPIHKQPMFREYNKEKLPITEEICSTTLSIPMYPSLKKFEQNYVTNAINQFVRKNH